MQGLAANRTSSGQRDWGLHRGIFPCFEQVALWRVLGQVLRGFCLGTCDGISSSDPLTYFGASGFLLVMGAAASAPAWRAATRDLLPTLRAD